MAEQEPKASIQVIERMIKLLDALARTPEPLTLKQLALETGLHPSTAHRILSVLVAERIAGRCEPGAYQLGIRLLELGNLVKSRISIREAALPFMRHLHGITGESVNLGVRNDDEIIYVERSSSGRSVIRVVHLVGARAPLHTTATGKLFLAEDGSARVKEYAKRTSLPADTANSITALTALEKELDRVRRHDIAFDNEEHVLGVRCIAAPIHDDTGVLAAGISVSAPAERLNMDWVPLVKQTADDVARAIGYVPEQRARR